MGFFGKSKKEKELSETTGGGFERPSNVSSFVRPTAEKVREEVRGGLSKIKEPRKEKSKFSLELSPALKTSKAPKQKKSQLEKMMGV